MNREPIPGKKYGPVNGITIRVIAVERGCVYLARWKGKRGDVDTFRVTRAVWDKRIKEELAGR